MRPAPDNPQRNSRVDRPVNVRAASGPIPKLDRATDDVLPLQGHPLHAAASCCSGILRHVLSFRNQPLPRP
jgi:hypothetical protein